MFTPFTYQRESLNFIEWSIEGFKRIFLRVKIIRLIHNLVMVVLKLVDNFKGMVIRWRKKGNVSCGSVVSIRVRVVNAEGTNTLEGV